MTGYPDLLTLPEARGMYLTFAGLTASQLKAKYGRLPTGNYPRYGVPAMQVKLAALGKSDGTSAGLTRQVFTDDGVTIPDNRSVTGKEIHIDAAPPLRFGRRDV